MSASLAGRRVLVTAGPTYEDLDPVRFLGNRSSGKAKCCTLSRGSFYKYKVSNLNN